MIKRMVTFIVVLLVGLTLSFATGLIIWGFVGLGPDLGPEFDGMPSFGFLAAFIVSILTTIIAQFLNSNRIRNTLGIMGGILAVLTILLFVFSWGTYESGGIFILAGIVLIPGPVIIFVLAWLTDVILNIKKAAIVETAEPVILQP